MRKENLVNDIVKMEWEFFDKVQNEGGRASCQNNWAEFEIFRKSQYNLFSQELLESYFSDLKQYQSISYNPIMLKYAYMMETTDNEAFLKIADTLPKIDEQKRKIIEQIVKIELDMRLEFAEKYPHISSHARAILTADDDKYSTSFETYLRGEISTYSPKTLYLYSKWVLEFAQNNKNLIEAIQENIAKGHGFASLEEAEKLN